MLPNAKKIAVASADRMIGQSGKINHYYNIIILSWLSMDMIDMGYIIFLSYWFSAFYDCSANSFDKQFILCGLDHCVLSMDYW